MGETDRGRRGRGSGRAVRAFALALGLCAEVLVVTGALGIVRDGAVEVRYASLSREVTLDRQAGENGAGRTIDWDSLRRSGANAVAWLTVEGTPIDYPVAQGSEPDPEFYLSHDLWGTPSGAGCPFIDARTTAAAGHTLVYGHHMGTTGLQFSSVSDAHRQETFDRLGNLLWHAPEDQTLVLRPLCATVVDMSHQPIQTFPEKGEDVATWVGPIVAEASAKAPDAESLAAGATKVVTLVTCSSAISGQRGRTIVLFACQTPLAA